jgi:hypothetical protein
VIGRGHGVAWPKSERPAKKLFLTSRTPARGCLLWKGLSMDSQAHEQQQKDFLASLFPAESTDHLQQGFDGGQQNVPMFQFNTPSHGNQQGLGMQQPIAQGSNPQISMDMLGSLMQSIDTQSHGTMSPQGPFNPQSMLEQQFKLTQLQQLQQLQNQIFQQQVR